MQKSLDTHDKAIFFLQKDNPNILLIYCQSFSIEVLN